MSYFASTAQRALSNLIDRLPDRDAAQKDIEIIYGALLMLDDHERCLREINATLFHHNKDREQTLARLGATP